MQKYANIAGLFLPLAAAGWSPLPWDLLRRRRCCCRSCSCGRRVVLRPLAPGGSSGGSRQSWPRRPRPTASGCGRPGVDGVAGAGPGTPGWPWPRWSPGRLQRGPPSPRCAGRPGCRMVPGHPEARPCLPVRHGRVRRLARPSLVFPPVRGGLRRRECQTGPPGNKTSNNYCSPPPKACLKRLTCPAGPSTPLGPSLPRGPGPPGCPTGPPSPTGPAAPVGPLGPTSPG